MTLGESRSSATTNSVQMGQLQSKRGECIGQHTDRVIARLSGNEPPGPEQRVVFNHPLVTAPTSPARPYCRYRKRSEGRRTCQWRRRQAVPSHWGGLSVDCGAHVLATY